MGFIGESRENDVIKVDSTVIEKLFPEGDSEFAGVLTSIKSIVGKKLTDVEIVLLYSDLVVGCSENVSPDKQRIRTQVHYPSLDNDLIVYRVLAFTQLHIKLPTFFLDKKPNKQMVDSLAKSYSTNDKFIAKNNRKPDSYDQNPQYGMSPDFPILVWGAEAAERYLGRLRDSANNPITWFLQGSISTETTFGNSDIYVLSNKENEVLGTIYINVYSHKEPKKAPTGFILAEPKTSTEAIHSNDLSSKQEIKIENDTSDHLINNHDNDSKLEEEPSSERCDNCQSPLEIGNKFCVYCGALVKLDQEEKIFETEQEDQHYELNEELEIKILPDTFSSDSSQADRIETQSLKCMSCGTSYVVGANFCSVCGARLSEVNHKIIEQPQEITSYVKCEHCETQNDSRSSYCEKCGKPLLRSVRENGKPSKRRISKAMFVIAITSALIISYFGVDYYIKFKADEEAKRIKEEYRQAKIDAALKDPSLYWYINFSSPTVGYSYSIRTASTYNTGVYLDNVKCVIVGIKVIKSSNSIYYLDDSIDGGKINLKSSEFTLNGLNPTIDSTGKNVCWRAYRDFNIVSSFNLSLYNTQTANFLFIIDMRSQISNVFFWRSKTIKILSDLFD